jgi:hypothetical protein
MVSHPKGRTIQIQGVEFEVLIPVVIKNSILLGYNGV